MKIPTRLIQPLITRLKWLPECQQESQVITLAYLALPLNQAILYRLIRATETLSPIHVPRQNATALFLQYRILALFLVKASACDYVLPKLMRGKFGAC
jgi:hypothetical protein